MSEVKYKIAAGTNVGLVRKNNEDNFVVCPDLSTSDWRIPQADAPYADLGKFGSLLVVADGMGGANAGEVASAIAVETVQESFTPDRLAEVVTGGDKVIQEFMKEVVKTADARIFKRSKEDRSTRGMGTTIVMAWVLADKVYVCWCGDSRCYMLNKRRGLMQLSKDHSYVQELVDRGELEPEFAADHPLSNVITRCLGDSESRAIPDTRIFQLHDGDTLLLCSDGLSGLCDDYHILNLLIDYREDPMDCKNELISAALNEGGHDNVTVALCNISMPGHEEQPDDDDDSLPQGLKANDNARAMDNTVHNSQSAKQPTVMKGHKKNSNFLWFLLAVIVVMLIAFFLVRTLNVGKPEKEIEENPVATTTDTLKAEKQSIINPDVEQSDEQEEIQRETIGLEEEMGTIAASADTIKN